MKRISHWMGLPLGLLTLLALMITASAVEPQKFLTVYEDFPNLDVSSWVGQNGVLLADAEEPYEQMKATLTEAIAQKSERIPLTNLTGADMTPAQLYQLYCNALYDDPEKTYFAQTGMGYSYPNSGDAYRPGETMWVSPHYLNEETYSDVAYQAAVDEAYQACIQENMTSLEKVAAAHDWLVANCQYDPYVSNNLGKTQENWVPYETSDGTVYGEDERVYTSYGAFVERNIVCQGYSLAFKVLMDRAGVPCCYVNNDGHAWNMVQLNGTWYHVDSTWDDPTYSNIDIGDFAGRVSRRYFLLSDEEFGTNHAAWTTEYGYECGSTCEAKDVLADAQTVSLYLSGDKLYLAKTDGCLYAYVPGGDLTTGTAVVSGLDTMDAAAFDYAGQSLYYVSRSNSYVNGAWVYGNQVFQVDLSAEQPQKKLAAEISIGQESLFRGIDIVESGSADGTRELRLRYAYVTVASWEIGMEETDGSMPVRLRYPDTLRSPEDLNGTTITLEEGEEGLEYQAYLACYGQRGEMLRLIVLTGTAGEGKTLVSVPEDAVTAETASVKLLVVSRDGLPLSAAVALESAETQL